MSIAAAARSHCLVDHPPQSCCFGEYNAAIQMTPLPESLAVLDKRCPGAKLAATKMC